MRSVVKWELLAANLMHGLLLLGVFLVLLTGYLIPTSEGKGVMIFDWFEVPALVSGLQQQEDRAGLVHQYVAYLVMGLVVLHLLAALKHHLINKDRTLLRIFGFPGGNNS